MKHIFLLLALWLLAGCVEKPPTLGTLISGEDQANTCADDMEKVLWEIDPFIQDLFLKEPGSILPNKDSSPQYELYYWQARDRAVNKWQMIKARCFHQ